MRLAHQQAIVVLLISKQYLETCAFSQITDFLNKQLEERNDAGLILDPASCLSRKARH